jgi:hypothetical protein
MALGILELFKCNVIHDYLLVTLLLWSLMSLDENVKRLHVCLVQNHYSLDLICIVLMLLEINDSHGPLFTSKRRMRPADPPILTMRD